MEAAGEAALANRSWRRRTVAWLQKLWCTATETQGYPPPPETQGHCRRNTGHCRRRTVALPRRSEALLRET